jgi:hypothetical protein
MVTSLKYVSMFFPETIETKGKGRKQQMHTPSQIRPRSPQHQVEVIGHDRVSIEFPASAANCRFEGAEERFSRASIREDWRPVIASRIDMVDYLGILTANWSSHAQANPYDRLTSTGPSTWR